MNRKPTLRKRAKNVSYYEGNKQVILEDDEEENEEEEELDEEDDAVVEFDEDDDDEEMEAYVDSTREEINNSSSDSSNSSESEDAPKRKQPSRSRNQSNKNQPKKPTRRGSSSTKQSSKKVEISTTTTSESSDNNYEPAIKTRQTPKKKITKSNSGSSNRSKSPKTSSQTSSRKRRKESESEHSDDDEDETYDSESFIVYDEDESSEENDDGEESETKTKRRKTKKTTQKTSRKSNTSSNGSSNRSQSSNRQKNTNSKKKSPNTVQNLYEIFEVEKDTMAEQNRERSKIMNESESEEEYSSTTSDNEIQKQSKKTFADLELAPLVEHDGLIKPYNKNRCDQIPLPQQKYLDDEQYDNYMNENNNDHSLAVGVKLTGMDEYESLIQRRVRQRKEDEGIEEDDTDGVPSNLRDESYISELIKMSVGKQASYKIKPFKSGHYINCDLRYFTLSSLGKFDVILIDPPWRVIQSRPQEAMMFSNTNFKLNYNTLSYEEIMDINVGSLCDQGFCFMWVLNSSLQFGLNLLNHWGFSYIDKITWIKKTKNDQIFAGTGYYFLHSTELLLVGVKHGSTKKNGQKLQYISKITNDILFSKVGIQSQKPNEVYEIIDSMVPGARKIEIFARNHNVRKGWLSIGNRLGEAFDKEMTSYSCYKCDKNLFSPDFMGTDKNIKRFKSCKNPKVNLCEKCSSKFSEDYGPYFIFENTCTEPIFHDWYSCDVCEMYPICGARFSCKDCSGDFDVCEDCFDDVMVKDSHQHRSDSFTAIEYPDPGCGYAVHVDKKCSSCLACPIIGERFMCTECKDVNLCRKCFFLQKEPKTHKCTHEISMIPEPRHVHQKLKCAGCGKVGLQAPIHKCKTCMSFILCNKCYDVHETSYDSLKLDKFTTHKHFHSFMRMK